MPLLSISGLAASIAALGIVGSAAAAPVYSGLSNQARGILSRSTQVAPHFVIYADKWVTGAVPDPSDITGYNVFALSFLTTTGSTDDAQNWEEILDDDQRTSILSEYSAAGIKLIVSAFGSTITPTSSGVDAKTVADTHAAWVKKYKLDGIDVDYEDLTAFDKKDGSAESWLVDYVTELRAQLPADQYLITAAPLAPWFSPDMWGTGGGFLAIDKAVGGMIDFYNVQFYNQGTDEYTTCDGLLTKSSDIWSQSSLFEIATNGVDMDKLVIGKPGTSADANNGLMDAGTLATCVAQAADKGWNAGVMVWQYPDADSSWISTVRGDTFPIGGSGGSSSSAAPTSTSTSSSLSSSSSTKLTSTTTSLSGTTTTSSAAPTSSSGSGSCSGVAAWQSGVAYTGGTKVTYNGHLWTAQWWTENETPGGSSGVWTDDGSC